jgi:hypothetical protein
MGQGLSCGTSQEHGLFRAVQVGDLDTVEAVLGREPALLHQATVYDRHSALHIAAANGQIEVGALPFHKVCSFSVAFWGWVLYFSLEFNDFMYIFFMGFGCVADFVNAFGSICESGCVESTEAGISVIVMSFSSSKCLIL